MGGNSYAVKSEGSRIKGVGTNIASVPECVGALEPDQISDRKMVGLRVVAKEIWMLGAIPLRELNDIRYFVKVAELRSFTSAAMSLGVSTPSVTKGIKRLENDLRSRLFHRTTRQLSLTDSGQIYFAKMQQILAEMDAATQLVRSANSSPEGRVRIGVTPAFGRLVLLPALSEFMRRNKNISLDLYFGHQSTDLIKSNFDIAMYAYNIENSEYKRRIIARGKRKTVASPAYLERYGAPRHPADLRDHRCIINPVAPEWLFQDPDGTVTNYQFEGPLWIDSGDAVRQAAVAGLGVAQSGWWLFESEIRSGKLVTLMEEHETDAEPLCLIYPGKKHVPARVLAVIDFIMEIGEKGWYCDYASTLQKEAIA